jgi:hypothetical protein
MNLTMLMGLYAALLILTRTLHICSLLENAGDIFLNNHSLQSMPCL